ncbi:MAG: PAS domain S-box protein [Chloroflexi bacterium]|nr:PAS domain S-box protein [Chloroflexota bacterium]
MITLDSDVSIRLQQRAHRHRISVEDMLEQWLDIDEDMPIELCHDVITHMTSSIIVTDVDSTVVYVNPACEDATGYTREEFIGQDSHFLQGDDRDQQQLEIVRDALKKQVPCNVVLRNYRKDGSLFFNELMISPIKDKHGEVTHFVGVQNDITPKVEALRALEESEARYRQVTELMSDYAFSVAVDEKGNQTLEWLTDSFTRITGYTHEEFSDPDLVREIMHPDDHALLMENRRLLAHGETVTGDYRLRIKDGRTLWLRIKRYPFVNEEGRLVRSVGIARDVTDEKLAFDTALETQDRFWNLAEQSPVLIWMSDLQRGGIYLNKSWLAFTGRELHEQLDFGWLERVHPDDRARLMKVYNAAFDRRETFQVSFRLKHHQGDYRWIRTTGVPRHTPSGEFAGYIGSGMDITDLVAAREKLEHYSEELETRVRERTAALEKNERRYRAISELATDYAFSYFIRPDDAVELEWMTDAFERWTGYSANDFSARELIELLVHEEDQPSILQSLADITKRPTYQELEYRLVTKFGNVLFTHTIVRSEWNETEQRVDRFVGVSRDITERKMAEEALRKSEERHRYLSEIASDYAFSFKVHDDRTLELEWVTDALRTITGFTKEDFAVAEIRRKLISPDYLDEWQRILSGLLEKPGTATVETEFVHKNGKRLNMRLILRSVGNNRVERLLGAASDVHEKTLAERALRESEARYRAISEMMSDYVFSFKVDENRSVSLEWVTDSVERVTGYSSQEFAHEEIRTKIVAPAFAADMTGIMRQLLRDSCDIKFDMPVITKTGEERYLQSYVRSLWDNQQQHVVRIIGAVTDVTERVRTEKVLIESEKRYRLISESLSDYAYSIYITPDLTFQLDWVTDAFERMTGYNPDDMHELDKWFPIIFHREDSPALEGFIRQLLRQQYSQNDIDVRMITTSGEQRYVRFTVRTMWSEEEHRVVRLIGVAKDITDRRLAELELRQSEARYRQVVETQTELINHYNIQTLELTFVNPAYCRFFDKTFDEAIGMNILTTVPEEEQERIVAYARDLYEKPRISENVGRVIAGDGSIRIINWVDQVILDDDGQPVEGQSIGTDITELVEAQEALATERNLLSKITAISPVGILLVERDGNLSFVNDAFIEIMQLERDQLIGQSLRNWPLRLENGSVIPAERRPFETILRTGEPIYNAQFRLNLYDGTHKILSISGVPMFEEGGTVARVLFNCEDITLRKRWEDELQKSYEKQKELNDLKSQFVSMVSHEFRTPLTIILTSTGLLRLYGDNLTTDQLHYRLSKIDTQITRLTHLLDDIAFINRGSMVGIPVHYERIHIKTFLNETIAEVNMAYPDNGGIIVENPDAIEVIETDENLLHHAIINLLTNAIKYSAQDDAVRVILALEDETFTLSVKDQGIGIPRKDQDKLFETFQRASNVGTISGTGLGLAITRQCVERVNGTVSFKSEEGEGSEFTISIPVSVYSKNDERLS